VHHNWDCPTDCSNALPRFIANGKNLADQKAVREGVVPLVADHLAP
jgi:hypothetical protein